MNADPYKSILLKITRFEMAQKTRNLDTKWPKTRFEQILFWAWCLKKKCREWSNPSKCEILAKTNEALSRKWRKTAKNT